MLTSAFLLWKPSRKHDKAMGGGGLFLQKRKFLEIFFRIFLCYLGRSCLFQRQNCVNCKNAEVTVFFWIKNAFNSKGTPLLQMNQIWKPYLIPILSNLKFLRNHFVVYFRTLNFWSLGNLGSPLTSYKTEYFADQNGSNGEPHEN